MRIALADDEKIFVEEMQNYLQRFGRENGIALSVTAFPDGQSLLEQYICGAWDLVILDVDMPGVNGIDTARRIREKDQKVPLMFITNLAQYAIKGYEVGAVDYLLKPVNYYALSMKMKKVVSLWHLTRDVPLVLKRNSDVMILPMSQLYYVESLDHSLHYHTAEGDLEQVGARTLADVEQELPKSQFVRCHNRYVVNLRHVDGLAGNHLCVQGRELPISRNRRRETLEALMRYAKQGGL